MQRRGSPYEERTKFRFFGYQMVLTMSAVVSNCLQRMKMVWIKGKKAKNMSKYNQFGV
jgi:hypothetical protein